MLVFEFYKRKFYSEGITGNRRREEVSLNG
jgi:hypothetical protein